MGLYQKEKTPVYQRKRQNKRQPTEWEKKNLQIRHLVSFLGGMSGKKNPLANADVTDVGSISGLRRFPGGGHGNPLQ